MRSNVVIFLLCQALGLTIFHVATAMHQGNETDRKALLEIKAKMSADPFGALSTWNESLHFCQWLGVTCGRRHRRVTVLDLGSKNLTGAISPYIGNLSFLRELALLNNSLTDIIPPEIGHLTRLENLFLNNNSLTGEIPANITGCSNLMSFVVHRNKLHGNIPEELASLSKLQHFSAELNNLTGGIPLSFGNLSSLVYLSIGKNSLTGSIPGTIGQLRRLEELYLYANNFSGTIPPAIFNLSSIRTISLSENDVQGSLPPNMGITLPNLETLGLYRNHFTGSIQYALANASKLSRFIGMSNNFTGKMPNFQNLKNLTIFSMTNNHLGTGEANDLEFISSLTNATKLWFFAMNANNFGGTLPESFNNLSANLAFLYLDNNPITGSIPAGIGKLVNLEYLAMWNTQLNGTIPTGIGKLSKLKDLILSHSQLSGVIPSTIGNLSSLIKLFLDGNSFHGNIPSTLGKCTNLLLLNLSQNSLIGTIPQQLLGLSSLSILLDLSQNHLTGTLSSEIGALKNLGYLDVSNNKLQGHIPSELGNCVKLEKLFMGGNVFQGIIPSLFSSLKGLLYLDLSRNNLSGRVPAYFGEIYLLYLNLSYNDFEGIVPTKGVFMNASATSVMGNSKLCGGISDLHLPLCKAKLLEKSKSSVRLKLIISTAFGLLGTTILCILLLVFCFRKRKEPTLHSPKGSILRLSYQSLIKATEGFSSMNLIGMGSFGSVYRGIIGDGKLVAVKVLNLQHRGASKSFNAECAALKIIRHRNLVKVVTACSSVDNQGNDFKAVVYEFMGNKSLDEWLHPVTSEYAEPRHLNLLRRLNVTIDVACALEYLHNNCQPPIVHCDIKPSNVLLDEEFTGHVGDFGLARLLDEKASNLSANQESSIGVKGSVGYTPPEYGMGSKVSVCGDVYSFGILLLEMCTKKRPTDDMFSGNMNLHNFAKTAFSEGLLGIADPTLLQQGEEGETSIAHAQPVIGRQEIHDCLTADPTLLQQGEEGERSMRTSIGHTQPVVCRQEIHDCLIAVLRLGIACSGESPRERKNIADAAAQLHLIRHTFLRNARARERARPGFAIQSSNGKTICIYK
ncbi:hypothetical protein RJ640_025445 [Escallonia rubra]|uniref:non-specific serine/threonine protein kinase n=1 Tax=Escallonia rubra TaxID=112253 RepID=A0AA88UJH1_9ASTE|nr:hypothetical protein RJ640_025445 [Escallonia rubra]